MTDRHDPTQDLYDALDRLVEAHAAELRRMQADHAAQIAALTATYRAAIAELTNPS